MSLPRVSYLESWEQSLAGFRRQQYRDQDSVVDSDDQDSVNHDLPEPSLSSSFPSTFSHNSLRYRLNFNPYAGPGWSQASVEDANDDYVSILGLSSTAPRDGQQDETAREEPQPPQSIGLIEPELPGPPTTSAFEVGSVKRIAQVFVAVIYCFLAAGTVFGFAALKPVLVKEEVYHNLCSGETVCYEQEMRLNLMFTIAAVVTNVSALPVGTILDTYGPRVCGIIGSFCLIIGALLFGFAASLPFDAYIPGYLFLSLGGPFVFIPSFHLSNTFPTRSGLILSMLTGAFDASSAIFLIFRLINEQTNGSLSTRKFFLLYLAVPIFIIAVQILLMPNTSYKTTGELVQQAEAQIIAEANDRMDASVQDPNQSERQRQDRRARRQSVVSKIQNLLDQSHDASAIKYVHIDTDHPNSGDMADTGPGRAGLKAPKPKTHLAGGVWGAMHGYSALQQIRSPWFILIALFTVLQMLRINYFVASIRQQYEYLLGSPQLARQINESFDFFLPLGGLISVPFIGTILDNRSTTFVLLVLVTTATLIGVFGCIPNSMEAGYANIALFVIYRPFYYTAVSDYSAKVFGFQTFGKVYGLIICLAGMGNFAQAGLDALTFKSFHRSPIPVNVILTGATFLIGSTLVTFVWWRARTMAAAGNIIQPTRIEDGGIPTFTDDGIRPRDWERQPLLSRDTRTEASSSYGTATA
ncbi:hypothetical protein MW887_005582 [Aspergillus wentii]|nr:hypothetical protein MW887_005582 [Aspergillus wentii]